MNIGTVQSQLDQFIVRTDSFKPGPDLKQSKGKGWYEGGPKGSGFPLLLKCPLCKRTIKTGDIAYAYNNPLPVGSIIVQHKECLEEILVDSPYTKLEKIKARVEAGGDFFE